MKITSCFTRQKLFVELKKASKWTDKYIAQKVVNTFKCESGGGLGTLFIGLAAILLAFVVFINIVDYSLFTYKRNAISKAMDYAVTAAVQQINKDLSIEGLSKGFAQDTGKRMLEGVEIDIDAANKSFLTVFYENYNPDEFSINDKLLLCATSTQDQKLSYTIKANTQLIYEGELDNAEDIEERINQAIVLYWPSIESNNLVYLNGNPKTNMVENGTYLLAFIKDIKITGLYSERNISLSNFAGAKLERQVQK